MNGIATGVLHETQLSYLGFPQLDIELKRKRGLLSVLEKMHHGSTVVAILFG